VPAHAPAAFASGSGRDRFSAKIRVMDLSRVAWISVIAACGLAAVLFALNGYTGYAITVGAVGAAAGVNLA
jgi:hypothetical protein